MSGICTFLLCIVAVFVLKEVLTFLEMKLIIPSSAQYFWVELTEVDKMLENNIDGFAILPWTLTAKLRAATKPGVAVICWVSVPSKVTLTFNCACTALHQIFLSWQHPPPKCGYISFSAANKSSNFSRPLFEGCKKWHNGFCLCTHNHRSNPPMCYLRGRKWAFSLCCSQQLPVKRTEWHMIMSHLTPADLLYIDGW